MNDPRWKSSNQQYNASREDRKTNLTKTAQMALDNQHHDSYHKQDTQIPKQSYQDNQQQYSKTGMMPISQVSTSEGDMRSQLRLLKSKMTFTSQTTDLDRETSNVSQQLNSINQRLQEKITTNQSSYSGYQPSSQPRTKSIPMNYRSQNQILEGENNDQQSSNSHNSTNNTNFGQQSKQNTGRRIPSTSNSSNTNNNTIMSGYDINNNFSTNDLNNNKMNNNNYRNFANNNTTNLTKQDDITTQFRQQNIIKPAQQQTYEPSAVTQQNKNYNQLSYQQQQELKKQQVNQNLQINQYQNKKDNAYNNNSQINNNQEQSSNNNYIQTKPNIKPTQQKENPYNNNNQSNVSQDYPQNMGQAQTKPNMKPAQRNAIDEISAVAKNQKDPKIIEESNPENEEDLIECPEGCGRQFREDALEKHTKICKKVFQSKRKVFNSKAHRVVEQEQIKLQKQNQSKVVAKKPTGKDPKWKQQSEQFRQMLQPTQPGVFLNKQTQDQPKHNPLEDDYVECPGCARKFNQNAADRHIPYCSSKQRKR